MPRKITIDDWKDKRDYNAWKLEVDSHNIGATHARYEDAVKVIKTAENARLEVLKSAHEKLYEKYEKIKGMDTSEDSSALDSDSGSDEILHSSDSDGNADEASITLDSESTTNDVSPASESEVIMEEPSESEIEAAEYMTDPKDYME